MYIFLLLLQLKSTNADDTRSSEAEANAAGLQGYNPALG